MVTRFVFIDITMKNESCQWFRYLIWQNNCALPFIWSLIYSYMGRLGLSLLLITCSNHHHSRYSEGCSAVQKQTAVNVFLKSNQSPLFAFALHRSSSGLPWWLITLILNLMSRTNYFLFIGDSISRFIRLFQCVRDLTTTMFSLLFNLLAILGSFYFTMDGLLECWMLSFWSRVYFSSRSFFLTTCIWTL